jgi:transcriptional regulator with XRE-family HTH domain
MTDIRVKDFYAMGRIASDASMGDTMIMKLNLAKLRRQRRLSQGALGDAVGVGQNSISRIERGLQQPKFDTLERIAACLNVEVFDLISEVNRSELDDELQRRLKGANESEKRAILAYISVLCAQGHEAP